MSRKLLCKSKNGTNVFFDPVDSHLATHFEDTAQLESLVKELIGGMELNGREIRRHFNMGRVVGTSDVVEVDETDEIIYAARKNRLDDGLVPFTKSRKAEPSRDVTVQLIPQKDGTYELISAWIGTFEDDDEPFPQSPLATERSKEYWDKYAFVWGSQDVIPGTERSVRPW